jgi:hypothetical protein
MKKILCSLIFLSIIFPLFASAADINFQPGDEINISIKCLNSTSGDCDNSFSCGITAYYPNNTLLASNAQMSFLSNGIFNYSFGVLSDLGTYSASTKCTKSGEGIFSESGSSSFQFSIQSASAAVGGGMPLNIISDVGGFYSPGDEVSVFSTITNATGSLVSATLNISIFYPNYTILTNSLATQTSLGNFKYNFTLPQNSPTGTYQIKLDANYSGSEMHDTLVFIISSTLKNIAENISDVKTNQQADFTVLMSDFGAIEAGKNYRAKVWVYSYNGTPRDADSTPTIAFYDPVRAKIC